MSHLGSAWPELGKLIVIYKIKSAPSNLSKCKVSWWRKQINFETEIDLLGILGVEFEKNYYHI